MIVESDMESPAPEATATSASGAPKISSESGPPINRRKPGPSLDSGLGVVVVFFFLFLTATFGELTMISPMKVPCGREKLVMLLPKS